MRESAHVCVHRKAETEIEMCVCECKWRFSSFILVNRKGWCPPTISSSSPNFLSVFICPSEAQIDSRETDARHTIWVQPKKKQTVTGKKARHDLNRMFENSSDQCCIEWGEEKEETKVKDRTIKRNKTNMFIFGWTELTEPLLCSSIICKW